MNEIRAALQARKAKAPVRNVHRNKLEAQEAEQIRQWIDENCVQLRVKHRDGAHLVLKDKLGESLCGRPPVDLPIYESDKGCHRCLAEAISIVAGVTQAEASDGR